MFGGTVKRAADLPKWHEAAVRRAAKSGWGAQAGAARAPRFARDLKEAWNDSCY
jgi:hypothetical protein